MKSALYTFRFSLPFFSAGQPRLVLKPTPVVDFIFLLGLLVDHKVGLVGSQLLNPDFLLHCPSYKRVNK